MDKIKTYDRLLRDTLKSLLKAQYERRDDRNFANKLYDDIIKALNTPDEAEPDNGWVSVKDRLPPTGVPVLIYVYNIEEMTVVSLDHDGLGFSNADEWFNIKNIHHWRPLPEPPKGECK